MACSPSYWLLVGSFSSAPERGRKSSPVGESAVAVVVAGPPVGGVAGPPPVGRVARPPPVVVAVVAAGKKRFGNIVAAF